MALFSAILQDHTGSGTGKPCIDVPGSLKSWANQLEIPRIWCKSTGIPSYHCTNRCTLQIWCLASPAQNIYFLQFRTQVIPGWEWQLATSPRCKDFCDPVRCLRSQSILFLHIWATHQRTSSPKNTLGTGCLLCTVQLTREFQTLPSPISYPTWFFCFPTFKIRLQLDGFESTWTPDWGWQTKWRVSKLNSIGWLMGMPKAGSLVALVGAQLASGI